LRARLPGVKIDGMGFLSRLLGRSTTPASTALVPTVFGGYETLEVVGESNYQDALWKIVGGFRRDPVRFSCTAVLLPEPSNHYDGNAIRVIAENHLVGYLAREDAAVYLPGLQRLIGSCESGCVGLAGQVVGGGPRRGGVGFLGVFLDHNPADFGVAPHYTTGGTLRTGFSEAIATDLADDSYDLSWLATLDDDDETAVARLRTLLDDEHDPIDRHYMLCEQETRLYRLRDRRPAALDEFDDACEQHHGEMGVLRQALLDKFGVVPLIEMYRQAAIRCQKAKRWEDAREWARRGLDVYGEQAARPEVVEDLHKRLAHAESKIAEATRPRERKPRAVAVDHVQRAPEIETLVCASCGGNFDRERTRGRKPTLCPTCRGLAAPITSA
jgi:hypothetical protein